MSDDSWIYEQDERERAEIRRRLAGNLTPSERANREAAGEPLANILAPLIGIAEKIRLRMVSTVCEGLLAQVERCSERDRWRCPERESPQCPRAIRAYQQSIARSRGAPLSTAAVYEGMGIPSAIARALAEDVLEPNDARSVVAEWWAASPRPRVLVLNGESQIGKTYAAAELCATWSGQFIHVPTTFVGKMAKREYRDSLLGITLVVFDDLGLEKLDGFDDFKACFDAVFCARVDAGMFTIIVTNCGSELRERYGDRVAERIKKHGWAKNIAVKQVRTA